MFDSFSVMEIKKIDDNNSGKMDVKDLNIIEKTVIDGKYSNIYDGRIHAVIKL